MKFPSYVAVFFLLAGSLVFSADDPAKAYYQSAVSFRDRAEYGKAYTEFSRIPLRFPGSPLAPEALYEMALCALYSNQVLEAGVQLQILVSQYPNSDSAQRARQLNAILYRLHYLPSGELKCYQVQNAYTASIPDMDNPTGLAMDSQRNVYFSDKDKKIVSVFDPAGKMKSTIVADSPYGVSIGPSDKILIANDETILSPGEGASSFTIWDPKKPEKKDYLKDIRSVAMSRSGQYLVVSRKEKGILQFDAGRKWLPNQTIAPTLEFSKVVLDSTGRIYGLDKDQKLLLVFSSDGKAVRTIQKIPGRMEFGKMEDFAVDTANHVYILTDDPHAVLIFAPTGELLKQILSDKKSSLHFDDGKLISVDSSGFIYILDKDEKRILKVG